jgi:hypothetical protein
MRLKDQRKKTEDNGAYLLYCFRKACEKKPSTSGGNVMAAIRTIATKSAPAFPLTASHLTGPVARAKHLVAELSVA